MPTFTALAIISVVLFVSTISFASYASVCMERFERATSMRSQGFESEARYFDLYDEAPDMYLSVDAKSGLIIQCNRTLLQVTGYKQNEVIGRHILEMYEPASREKVKELFTLFRKTGRLNDEELQILRKDGTSLDVSLNSTAVRNADGSVSYSRSSWRDISARKRTERALRESEEKFRIAVEAMPQLVWSADPDGNLDFVNQRWVDFTGFVPGGRESPDVIHPDDFAEMDEQWKRSVVTGETFEMEYRLRNYITGEYRWFLAKSVPMRTDEGVIFRWFGTCTDIEDIKRAREERTLALIKERAAEESSRLKTEFLAMMSHEIRTPLNGVIGMSELLLRANLKAEHKEYAKTIHQSAETLNVLVNDILDLSKIESGKLELDKTIFDLRELLSGIKQEMHWAADRKKLMFKIEGMDSLPQVIEGDPTRLRQILSNLLSNAIKFTEHGQVVLVCGVTKKSGDNIYLAFEVSDTGIGIDSNVLSKLFKPFTQADSSTTRKYGGTGLGLSISKQLVEMMNGQISVRSEVGKGTTFAVELQFTHRNHLLISQEGEQRPLKKFRGRHVLVADDAQVNQNVLRLFLESLECNVTVVDNGQGAVDAVAKQAFDLILMDCYMPLLDGFMATERIRLMCDRRIPIIAITANAYAEDRERCLKAGMDDYLSKPVKLEQIEAKLNIWLQERRIDWSVFEDFRSISLEQPEKVVIELVELFEKNLSDRLSAIRLAKMAGALGETQKAIHAFKSGAAYLGAIGVRDLLDQMQKAVSTGDFAPIDPLLVQVEEESRQAISAIRERFSIAESGSVTVQKSQQDL